MDSSGKNNELTVRTIAPTDAAAACRLCEQLGYQRDEHAILEWIERLAAIREFQAAFVACMGDEVVGWIEVSIEHRLQYPPFALIGGLVVKDGIRGQGIGRQLCARAEAWAWQRPVDTVRVTSRSTRLGAHRFYLRDGYRQVKTSLVFELSRPKKHPMQ
jgi:predicted N-acetyltransferase YhbS